MIGNKVKNTFCFGVEPVIYQFKMLDRKKRLSTSLLKDLFKNPNTRNIHGKHFFLKFTKNPAGGESRFAVSVSKKVAKKAVDRNSLKRKGYGVIRKLVSSIKPEYLVVLYIKKDSLNLTSTEFENEIIDIFKRSGLL